MSARDMNEVCGIEREETVRVLRLAGRGSSDMDFCERTNEGDGVEGVADPHHRETVGNLRNEMRCIDTLELDALVEIIDCFPEPHTNDQKRGDT